MTKVTILCNAIIEVGGSERPDVRALEEVCNDMLPNKDIYDTASIVHYLSDCLFSLAPISPGNGWKSYSSYELTKDKQFILGLLKKIILKNGELGALEYLSTKIPVLGKKPVQLLNSDIGLEILSDITRC